VKVALIGFTDRLDGAQQKEQPRVLARETCESYHRRPLETGQATAWKHEGPSLALRTDTPLTHFKKPPQESKEHHKAAERNGSRENGGSHPK
jgi:hypothetical protein